MIKRLINVVLGAAFGILITNALWAPDQINKNGFTVTACIVALIILGCNMDEW
jgi:hypothetical protein